MKKVALFLVLITCFISCEKYEGNSMPKEPALQPGEEAATGTLSYACVCLDGGGLIFGTDDHKTLVFDDSTTNYATYVDSMTSKYKEFMDVHSRLIYKNTGDSRCNYGMTPGCILVPIVKIVRFTNQ
jgi:hypothetical protein